jgi:hypothetical protein
MAKAMNLDAASGKNIIDDDTVPTLTLENSSSGEALRLQNTAGTGVLLSLISAPTTGVYAVSAQRIADLRSAATAIAPIYVDRTVLSSSTVGLIKINASGASAPAFTFSGTCVQSTGSGTASLVGAVRVSYLDPAGNVGVGWIGIMGNIDKA